VRNDAICFPYAALAILLARMASTSYSGAAAKAADMARALISNNVARSLTTITTT
jgi:hypothetical protein